MGNGVETDFANVMNDIIKNINEKNKIELANLTESELEKFWHFKFNSDKSNANNLYKFIDMLDIYKRRCRQWEEQHNGSSCVVERVRDKYLMPKIKEFINEMKRSIPVARSIINEVKND